MSNPWLAEGIDFNAPSPPYIPGMIKSPDMLRRLDERYERERLADMTYHEVLQRFTALWEHARAMGAVDHRDWLADLEPDLRIAHALNALPEED